MKNVLKIWLVDNTVTVDNKDDKIGQLESSGNLSLKDILDEMHKEDTGLRPETIEHVVKLYNRVVSDLILSGYSVNTGLYHAVAQLRGVIDGGKWNPEKNSVYVSFTQDKELREAIAQTSISILGERQSVMYVAGFSPATATAGRPFTVNGRMLKLQVRILPSASLSPTAKNKPHLSTSICWPSTTRHNSHSLFLPVWPMANIPSPSLHSMQEARS